MGFLHVHIDRQRKALPFQQGQKVFRLFFREDFRQKSLPVIFWNGLLTFNFRSFWLFLFCLIDLPALYFLFEIFVMGLLTWYVNHRHETFCHILANKI